MNKINNNIIRYDTNLYFFKSQNLNFLFNNFLYRDVKIFFFKYLNKIFFKEKFLIISLFLVKNFFFKNLKKNFTKFIFLTYNKFFSFFSNFFNIYNNINCLYFFRLKLKGLGFVLKRFSKYLFSFSMELNHFFYFFVPRFILLKKKKKHIICLSLDLIKLNLLFWHLLFLRKHNVYVRTKKLKGFIKTNFIRFIKKKNKL